MSESVREASLKTYWLTWVMLFMVTLVMILIGTVSMPKVIAVSLLLLGMFAKASLIGAYFMHLRYEKITLVAIVAVGIFFTAAALFFLIASDGARILDLSAH